MLVMQEPMNLLRRLLAPASGQQTRVVRIVRRTEGIGSLISAGSMWSPPRTLRQHRLPAAADPPAIFHAYRIRRSSVRRSP